MKSFFNTIINWLFKKSWITLLLVLAVPFVFIKTSNGWILFFSLLYYMPAAIIHYKGKRGTGYIASHCSAVRKIKNCTDYITLTISILY